MDDYMDKEKAADLLDNLIGMVDDSQGNDYNTALKMGIEALKADAQPVRHGRWEKDPRSKRTRCSECYSVVPRDDYRRECLSDYCSVCGARMDGE